MQVTSSSQLSTREPPQLQAGPEELGPVGRLREAGPCWALFLSGTQVPPPPQCRARIHSPAPLTSMWPVPWFSRDEAGVDQKNFVVRLKGKPGKGRGSLVPQVSGAQPSFPRRQRLPTG